MPLIRLAAVAWVAGGLVARVADAWPLSLQIAACVMAVLGLSCAALGGTRLGLGCAIVGVAMLVTPPAPVATPALFDGKPWDLVARVDGMPRRSEDKVSMPIDVEVVRRGGAPQQASARLRFVAPRLREPLAPGDRLLVHARVSPVWRSCNFGACDGAWRAAADELQGSVAVSSPDAAMRFDEPHRGARAGLWVLREAMRRQIEAVLPESEAQLVSALVLGERGVLSAKLETDFRAVGITHLLSVSGLHLAFAAGLLFSLARALLARLAPQLGALHPRDRWAALVSLPIVVAYAVLTGAEVATLRAALVVAYAFAAVVGARRLRGDDALAFAALALLVAQPARLFDVSFQLSFVAALATLIVARATRRAGPTRPRGALSSWVSRLTFAAWGLVLVSFGATLATAPLTAWWFSEIAPMGVISNVVAVPLTELAIVPLGIAGSLAALVWPPLGRLPLLLSGACTLLLTRLAEVVAGVSPVFRTGRPTWLVVFVCAVVLVWLARAPGARRTLVAVCVVVSVVVAERVVAWWWPAIEVCFLDVGQGDAAVAVLTDRRAIVVDGGPGHGDAASRTVADFLARRGVQRIALLVLSHPHPDHSGGLPGLLSRFSVDVVWWNGQLNGDPATRELLTRASATGVRVVPPRSADLDGVHVEALAPFDFAGEPGIDPLASENDNSLVVAMTYAGRRLLFSGDIEDQGERGLVRRRPGTFDVLKVPHHGSRTSSSDALLEAIRPSLAVASLAADNRYRFPHPDVVARYRDHGIPLLRTDRDGAVRVRIDARGRMSIECASTLGCRTP